MKIRGICDAFIEVVMVLDDAFNLAVARSASVLSEEFELLMMSVLMKEKVVEVCVTLLEYIHRELAHEPDTGKKSGH